MKTALVRMCWLYSGVLGVVVLLSGIITAMRRVHLGLIDPRPISYLGLYSNTKLLFSFSLIASAILFIAFGLYIAQLYTIRRSFLACYILGQLCQIIVALVPDKIGSALKPVHTIAGFALALSLPFLMRELAGQNKQTLFEHRLFVGLYRFEQIMFVVGIGLFVSVKGIAPLGEALPTVGFDLWIVCVTLVIARSLRKK